ncbi:hypothetical protein NPS53_08695 [Pseudomonas putida]|uniref:hypothetical protein n=1 Tax=Pseudomonas putida TaxID=303 RepID=UPI0023643ACD|nr:hypothetical protein [Pseudomonas putida]MDD2139651.1 hypothetical protein [Pseudomonas putida]HDS1721574.1 hypothetical protein [Pseudomonas putida]
MREIADPFAAYFRLKTPCSKCPFRKDSPIELRPGRLEGIIEDLLANDGNTFTCHNTLSPHRDSECDLDDDGEPREIDYRNGEKMCAGAAAYLMKVHRPTVGMRYAMSSGSIGFDQWEKAVDTVIDPIITNTKD